MSSSYIFKLSGGAELKVEKNLLLADTWNDISATLNVPVAGGSMIIGKHLGKSGMVCRAGSEDEPILILVGADWNTAAGAEGAAIIVLNAFEGDTDQRWTLTSKT